MADFFNSALQFFQSIGNFIQMIVSGLAQFFKLITYIINPSFFTIFNNILPVWLTPFLILGFLLLVIKVLLDLI